MARHVKRGDTVIVTAGDHKGKTGEVMRVDVKKDRVYIKGLNLRTKHMRPTRINPQGGVITKEAPVHISNVSPVVDGMASRVRFERDKNGQKQRIAVRNGKSLGAVSAAKSGRAGS
ncbi:MAG: 50S ribosomal protein L24 [Phycisphaerae bacterium]|nr:50S ribosomal protein L24 [Phycisphaerae bacterium]|tara:strand:+ start:207 stop:554 length:348 start_codon:yes stop_codon:yes gene_type:complete